METFIKNLEKSHIKPLISYYKTLKTTSWGGVIFDYNKYKIFNDLKTLDFITWREFRIGDLFEIKPTKAYKMTNSILFLTKGNVPVVTNSSFNNGVSGYVALEPTEKGNMITYSDTTTSEGIFYQPRDFVGYSHVQGLYPIKYKSKWSNLSLLYFVATFRKTAHGRFDYGNKFNRNIAKDLKVTLPTDSKGNLAFEFMENTIKALKKEAAKNVILYNDAKIKATKKYIKTH
ncbi:restriction endonuclease subunit S [Campylobacter canadensis]|nr:restriction endonuclease subunit S [Campylobacter canadensis]